MSIDAINSAQSWASVAPTSTTNNAEKTAVPSVENVGASGSGNSSNEEEELTTKITTATDGQTIMIYMRGNEVVKTVKLGNSGPTLENLKAGPEQQYVENGTSDIGSVLNSSV